MLLQRQKDILTYLKNQQDWVKGNELSKVFNVSRRTIRTDVQSIRDFCGEDILISSRNQGYKYNLATEVENIKTIKDKEERIIYLLKELVLNSNGVNIFDIAEEVYVSEWTINNDIRELKNLYRGLKINVSREIVKLDLKKEEREELLLTYIREYIKDYRFEQIFKIFKNNSFKQYHEFVKKVTKKYNFILRYYSKGDLMIIMLLSLGNESIEEFDKNSYYEEILGIIKSLKIEEGAKRIAIEISKRIENLEVLNEKEKEIRENLKSNRADLRLLEEIIDKANKKYHLDIKLNEQIKSDLWIHILLAVERCKRNIIINNPLKEYIKNEIPFLFDVAMFIGDEIESSFKIRLNVNEICYITSYVGVSIENQSNVILIKKDLMVVIIALEGKSITYHLFNRLEQTLGDNINKVIISSQEELNMLKQYPYDIDLVITTSNISIDRVKREYIISPNITIMDEIKIREIIEEEESNRKKEHFKNVFNYFFKEELYVQDLGINSREQAIGALYSTLEENGYVDIEFYKGLRERENLLSTSIDSGVAIPHATNCNAIKSGVCVGILNKPVLWGRIYVKVVLLFAVSREDTKKQIGLYDYLIKFLGNKSYIEKLSRSKSFEEFKKILEENI